MQRFAKVRQKILRKQQCDDTSISTKNGTKTYDIFIHLDDLIKDQSAFVS